MNNNITIRNIDPQQITISGAGQPTGITNVYVNGVDVTVGTKAYVLVPTNNNELINGAGYITAAEETDPTVPSYVKAISLADINSWNDKQDQLVSTQNIKSINGESILGSGNLEISTQYRAGDGISIEDDVISNTITSYNDLSDTPTIPSRTSDLVNDSGFITNQTDSLVNYLTTEVLEDILPHTSDSGTGNLYLEDSAKYKIKMELKPSEIEQYTTTGVNLFGKELFDTSMWYVIGTEDEFTIQAIAAGTTEQAIPYDLNTCKFDGTIYYENMDGAIILREGTTSRGTILAVYDHSTATVDKDISMVNRVDNLRIVVYNNTCKITFRRCQLQSGNTATPFELYTGGMPSPSISYPQPVQTTSGEIKITVSSKNLLDTSTIEQTIINGITCTYDSTTQEITFNGTCSTDNTNFEFVGTSFESTMGLTTASAYYVSGSVTNYCNLRFLKSDYGGNMLLDLTTLNDSNKTVSVTANANNTLTLNRIRFNNGSVANNFTIKVMFADSTDTTYAPYQTQEYEFNFNNVGTISRRNYVKIQGSNKLYEDRIFINNPNDPDYSDSRAYNGVYVKLDSLFLQLTSSFNWIDGGVEEAGTHTYKIENYSTLYTAIEPTLFYCEYFTNSGKDKITLNNNGTLKVQIDDNNNISSLDEFKNWLDELGMLRVYTPTSYPIYMNLESTVMGNAYKNMTNNITAYEGGTNISQEYDDLPLIIEADTLKKVS